MCVAILTGLHRPSILRLKNTWALVNPKITGLINQIMAIISPKDEFAGLRNHMPNAKYKPIPYMGVYLLYFEDLYQNFSTGIGFSAPGSFIFRIIFSKRG